MKYGWTFLETILVFAIFSLMILWTAPLANRFYRMQLIEEESVDFMSALRRARAMAISSRLATSSTPMDNWSVMVSSTVYVLYKGQNFSGRDINYDEIEQLPSDMFFSYAGPITFFNATGTSSVSTTIQISNDLANYKIDVDGEGKIERAY